MELESSRDAHWVRLLRLKRYEVPPPGFFDGLPGRIRRAIESREAARRTSRWLGWLAGLRKEPSLAAAYAALAFGLVVFGGSVFRLADGEPAPDGRMLGASLVVAESPVDVAGQMWGAAGTKTWLTDPLLTSGSTGVVENTLFLVEPAR